MNVYYTTCPDVFMTFCERETPPTPTSPEQSPTCPPLCHGDMMCMLLLESSVRIGISVSGFPVCSLGTCRLEMPVCSCSNRPFPPLPPTPKPNARSSIAIASGDPVREALHPFTDISPPRYRYIFLNSGDPVRVRECACAKRTSGYSTPF